MNINRRNPFEGMPDFSMETKKKSTWKYVVGIFLFILLHQVFSLVGYNIFVILDNAFSAHGSSSPGFMWCLVGSLCGIVIGSIVAVRKFKLSSKINLFSSIPAGLLIFSLFISAGPLGQITPRAEDVSTPADSIPNIDTTAIVNRAKVKRKKVPQLVKKKETKPREAPVTSDREEETPRMNLTVKPDSVR